MSILGMSSRKVKFANFRLCKFLSSKFVCRSEKGAQEKNEIYTTGEPLSMVDQSMTADSTTKPTKAKTVQT